MQAGNTQKRVEPGKGHCCFVLAMVLTLVTAGIGAAKAADVWLRLAMPEVVALRYFPSIEVRVEGAEHRVVMKGVVSATGGPLGGGLPMDVEFHLDEAAATAVAGNFVSGRLENAFSVRAVAHSGRVQIAIRVEQESASNADGAELRLVDASLQVGQVRGRELEIEAPGVVRSAAGAMELILDLDNATSAGWYRGTVLVIVADVI